MKYLLFLAMLLSEVTLVWAQADDLSVQKQAWEAIRRGQLVIDVRSADEFASGHIDGAINIPHDQIAQRFSEIKQAKNAEIVVYCRSGRRSSIAKKSLEQLGFMNVLNAGGYSDLVAVK